MLSFDNKDLRRDLTCEMFRYENSGMTNIVQKPIAALTVYCGKWNRLFMATPLGSTSNKGTGINYTYMRYADVLLMYAEAANENHNGPTPQAKEALKKVRNRAFAAEDQPEMDGIPDHFKNLLPHCGQSGALNYLWKVTGSITENTFLSPCRSTVILPEWFVTIECAMDRPSPK